MDDNHITLLQIRQQAATFRTMEPLFDRLQLVARARGWPLGKDLLTLAVEELERGTRPLVNGGALLQ